MTLRTLKIIPPPGVEEQFRNDYAVMQAQMIYGAAPDFDMIIDELKHLAGLLVMQGRERSLDVVVEEAKNALEQENLHIDISYLKEMDKGHTPDNIGAAYRVTFTNRNNQFVFHTIEILL